MTTQLECLQQEYDWVKKYLEPYKRQASVLYYWYDNPYLWEKQDGIIANITKRLRQELENQQSDILESKKNVRVIK